MFKFDVRYTIENYYEYYKFVLVKQRIFRDLFFSLLFVGIAVYWWVDTTENTNNEFLPWFAIIMAVIAPLMNFISLPSLKKQLVARKPEIDRTHILIEFNDEEVVYDNQSTKPEPVKEEVKEEAKPEVEGEAKEEVKEEKVEENKEEQHIFNLKYNNFLQINETENLLLINLDRQTIIILPKNSIVEGNLKEFKAFLLSKVPAKRVHFLKEK